jgi:Domain of unknown function (DUF4331)
MSHHFDTVIAREDPRLNILDFYLFRGQSGTTVMAMTVNPNAGTKAPDTFHEEGLYAFRFDVNDNAHEEVTFKIRFGEVGMSKARGPKAGTYKLSRCVGPPGGMPQKARTARSSLRALPAGSSRATRVCGSSLAWPRICSLRTGQVRSRSAPHLPRGNSHRTCFTTARTTSKTATSRPS